MVTSVVFAGWTLGAGRRGEVLGIDVNLRSPIGRPRGPASINHEPGMASGAAEKLGDNGAVNGVKHRRGVVSRLVVIGLSVEASGHRLSRLSLETRVTSSRVS